MIYDYDRREASQDIDRPEDFGELHVAEYLVFLLSLDTYLRYLQETKGEDSEDEIQREGLRLLRIADGLHQEAISAFLSSHLTTTPQRQLLARALRYRPTAEGVGQRAFWLRTLLSRGGTSTMRAVFAGNKARAALKEAIAASMVDDADKALDLFAVIPLRNTRLRTWIDKAAETAGSGEPQNPMSAVSASGVSEDANALLVERVRGGGSSATSVAQGASSWSQDQILTRVKTEAEETAKRSMAVSKETDAPPKKSEVIGLATAAAVAALADPNLPQNVPSSLQSLDPEQLSAALTDGRVLVAAGAGSGKTSTLVARLGYLVKDRKVSPSRIFVVSFNVGAAGEIKERLVPLIGQEALDQMSAGTMHAIFKRFVTEYGTAEERAALTTWLMTPPRRGPQQNTGRAPSPMAFAGYMARIWRECYGEDPPSGAGNVIQSWVMNNVTPEAAKSRAIGPVEVSQAEWYRWTLGFKGVDKKFEPPCARSNPKAGRMWGEFLAKWRDNGRARLGDFSDMIVMFRDLLKRDPVVRRKVQAQFDHIAVDEAQDLNQTQHEIIAMMSEHITDDRSGKSVWIVGDEVQSVNAYVGARPELFAQFHGKEGWTERQIATNYRCLPEIVEAANRLLANHPRGIPMQSRPDPRKPRGSASIVVRTPGTHVQGAIGVIEGIKQDLDAGASLSDYAVLARTNRELADYETSCIINGIPYARRGGTSFLRSPETITVMSYFNLAVGTNFERMQKSLGEVLNKPNRFFLSAGAAEAIVDRVVADRARRDGVSDSQVNPVDLFDDDGIRSFLRAMDPGGSWQSWRIAGTREQLVALGQALDGMRQQVKLGVTVDRDGRKQPYTTQSLLGDILAIRGVAENRGGTAPTLRDTLMPFRGGPEEEADAPMDEDASKKPIGNVEFLFQIAQPSGDPENDPSSPIQFKARIDQLVAASKDLRVDLDVWNVEQKKLPPAERSKPPCVVLSTCHATKGAQWANTTVIMAQGIFPFEGKSRVDESKLTPAQQAELAARREREFMTERQLAYVAMTRAAKDLTIVCPSYNAYGREAGVSPFVLAAGLKVGQNVAGKNDPTPEAFLPPVTTVLAYIPRVDSPDLREEVLSYDRR